VATERFRRSIYWTFRAGPCLSFLRYVTGLQPRRIYILFSKKKKKNLHSTTVSRLEILLSVSIRVKLALLNMSRSKLWDTLFFHLGAYDSFF
jgi:hypothetical protein